MKSYFILKQSDLCMRNKYKMIALLQYKVSF